jgi:hypothetical protein
MASRPDLTAVGQQALAYLTPGRMWPVQFHRVEPLDLDGPEAERALDPEELAGDLGNPPLLDGQPRPRTYVESDFGGKLVENATEPLPRFRQHAIPPAILAI